MLPNATAPNIKPASSKGKSFARENFEWLNMKTIRKLSPYLALWIILPFTLASQASVQHSTKAP